MSQVMWDGIDCHRCRMLGWKALSWDEPEIRFVHLRQMGSSDHSVWEGRKRHGFGQYFMGTTPVYMAASAAFRMTQKPYVVGGLAMWWGYMSSALSRKPRYEDTKFRKFLRSYQWAVLFRGKDSATSELEAKLASRWEPPQLPEGKSVPRLGSGVSAEVRDRSTVPAGRAEKRCPGRVTADGLTWGVMIPSPPVCGAAHKEGGSC